jgi:hypothetical protein
MISPQDSLLRSLSNRIVFQTLIWVTGNPIVPSKSKLMVRQTQFIFGRYPQIPPRIYERLKLSDIQSLLKLVNLRSSEGLVNTITE